MKSMVGVGVAGGVVLAGLMSVSAVAAGHAATPVGVEPAAAVQPGGSTLRLSWSAPAQPADVGGWWNLTFTVSGPRQSPQSAPFSTVFRKMGQAQRGSLVLPRLAPGVYTVTVAPATPVPHTSAFDGTSLVSSPVRMSIRVPTTGTVTLPISLNRYLHGCVPGPERDLRGCNLRGRNLAKTSSPAGGRRMGAGGGGGE